MDAMAAIGSARSMRWLRPDPVPAEMIRELLWAATRASSAHNSQPWHFVVLRDATVREQFGRLLKDAADASNPLPAEPHSRADRLIDAGVRNLFATIGTAPVIILVCAANIYPPAAPNPHFLWSAVHAAAQNLIVAARALELGAAYTMLHRLAEPAIRELLAIPAQIEIGVTIPIGFPARPFGNIARKPLEEFVHTDAW